MLLKVEQMAVSDYNGLYERLIPKTHILRRFNELVDFGFIYDELESKYCLDNGRNAYSPVMMFKYLLLKSIYNMSDADLVERSMFDMSFKYFLGLRLEDDVIDSSSLTKFRKQRLKDENMLDLLIGKSVEIALANGVIKSKAIIVDATHSRSRYNQKSVSEVLREQAKLLRKAVYAVDESQKELFPSKIQSVDIEENLGYCESLLSVIEGNETLMALPAIREKAHVLRESVDDSAEHLKRSADEDAKLGHKSADTAFFGYKTHLAMTPENIITAAVVTSGEKGDGNNHIIGYFDGKSKRNF